MPPVHDVRCALLGALYIFQINTLNGGKDVCVRVAI